MIPVVKIQIEPVKYADDLMAITLTWSNGRVHCRTFRTDRRYTVQPSTDDTIINDNTLEPCGVIISERP